MQEPQEVNYFPPSKQVKELMDTIVYGSDYEEIYADQAMKYGEEKMPSDETIDAMVAHQQK